MVEFKTEKFEGPLDLLLALIQKAEVNIYDIPISEITDQFLEYLHHADEIGRKTHGHGGSRVNGWLP